MDEAKKKEEAKKKALGHDLVPDTIIDKLVPDPSNLTQTKRRVGWLGKSTREGYARLYLNLSLSSYAEFRKEDVIHTVPLASEQRPLGGTVVFLRQDADILHTRTTFGERQAEWLAGDIMRAVMGSGSPIRGFAPNPPGPVAFNPTEVITIVITITIAFSLICPDGPQESSNFTLTGTTLCVGGVGSC
jgi:hypothetical protein